MEGQPSGIVGNCLLVIKEHRILDTLVDLIPSHYPLLVERAQAHLAFK